MTMTMVHGQNAQHLLPAMMTQTTYGRTTDCCRTDRKPYISIVLDETARTRRCGESVLVVPTSFFHDKLHCDRLHYDRLHYDRLHRASLRQASLRFITTGFKTTEGKLGLTIAFVHSSCEKSR
jgi:hypothetical protein